MRTMHPVLPIGPYDWAEDVLPTDEFIGRVDEARKLMIEQDWAGIAIFGDIPECGMLSYFTNYTPKLAWGLVLIPREGPLRILSGDGGRMVPAGKLLTWIEDVRPTRDLGESISDWDDELPTRQSRNQPVIGTGEFGIMPSALHDGLVSGAGEALTLSDATNQLRALTAEKSDREIAVMTDNCRILDSAAATFRDKFGERIEIAECVLAAETTARNGGAQDTRALFSADGGHTLIPFQELSAAGVERGYAYLAIKRRGYWVEGLLSAGDETLPIRGTAIGVLHRIIASTAAGSSYDILVQAAGVPEDLFMHPFTGVRLGNGIGVSLAEPPLIEKGSGEQLVDGSVYSFRVGLTNSAGDTALVSAMVHLAPDGVKVLWSS